MERIAFILGEYFLSWSTILVTLASAGAVCLFLSAYLRESGNVRAAAWVVPLAMILSLAAARLLHWYCFEENYESLLTAMTDYSRGGFSLTGVFAGCLLAALLTRIFRLHRNLPQMLDCMCLAGSAGIAVGRLSSFYNATDRGQIVQSVRSMPWVYPLTNSVSGLTEYRLATFLHQAMVAAAIFLALALFLGFTKKKHRPDGDAALIFLLCYGASEVILDSMRYDSMYFRSNGFVSIIQVLGAVALGFVIVVFSVRLVRSGGFRPWYIALWLGMAALIGLAGYMEYHVQRHGNEALFAYSVMGACLSIVVFLALLIRGMAGRAAAKARAGRFLKA